MDLKEWARRRQEAPLVRETKHVVKQPTLIVASSQPSGLITAMPSPAGPPRALPQSGAFRPGAKREFIVKPDPQYDDDFSRYRRNLAVVPDLMGGAAPSADALQMTGGIVEQGEYKDWTPATRNYLGVSERNSQGDFTEHRRRRDRELASG